MLILWKLFQERFCPVSPYRKGRGVCSESVIAMWVNEGGGLDLLSRGILPALLCVGCKRPNEKSCSGHRYVIVMWVNEDVGLDLLSRGILPALLCMGYKRPNEKSFSGHRYVLTDVWFWDKLTGLSTSTGTWPRCLCLMSACLSPLPLSASAHGLTFTWWGCCGLCLWHKPTELVHSFIFCSCVSFCLYGSFKCISLHEFFRQLSLLSHSVLLVLFLP